MEILLVIVDGYPMKPFCYFIASIILALPVYAHAYGIGTHAHLTKLILDAYSERHPGKIGKNHWSFVIDGSRREDDHPRYLNHFYDPLKETGLRNFFLGTWNSAPEWAVKELEQERPIYKTSSVIATALSAVENNKLSLVSGETDFTWQKGIQAYVEGDEGKAMFILGHTLHLIEDMGVPDHTRNDPHPLGSPYERWSSKFNLDNPDNSILGRINAPFAADSLREYFASLAAYSNSNFFSADTIRSDGYALPDIDYVAKEGKYYYAFRKDELQRDYHLAVYKRHSGGLLDKNSKDIDIEVEDSEAVFKDYWDRLAPKIVEHGAGLIELFLGEIEKAKSNPNPAKTDSRSFFAGTSNIFQGITSNARGKIRNLLSGDIHISGISHGEEDVPVANRAPVSEDNSLAGPELEAGLAAADLASAADRIETSPDFIADPAPPVHIISPPEDKVLIPVNVNVSAGSSGGSPANTGVQPQVPQLSSSSPPAPDPEEPVAVSPALVLGSISATYIATTSKAEFSWEPAVHADSSTSTITYKIHLVEGASTTEMYAGSSSDVKSYRQYERDRDYEYLFSAEDEDGNIATTTLKMSAPGFLGDNEVFFYRDYRAESRNRYLIDIRPGRFPFIPPEVLRGMGKIEQGIIAYLSRDPNEMNNTLGSEEPDGIFKIGPWERHSWVFMSDPDKPPEDLRFVIEGGPDASSRPLTDSDYITLAYYTYDAENGGSLRIAGYSKKRFHLSREAPDQLPPLSPVCNCGSGRSQGKPYFYINWHQVTDPDSPDASLRYEWNVSPGPSIDNALWRVHNLGFPPQGAYQDHFVTDPGVYTVALRAVDEFGAASEPAMATFNVE